MANFDFNWSRIDDFGHHCIWNSEDCLYDYVDETLTDALISNEDFDTSFHGFKHSLESMRIVAKDDTITVSVYLEMDDLDDLVNELDLDIQLTEEQQKELINALGDDGFVTEVTLKDTLGRTSTLQEILVVATRLSSACEDILDANYKTLCDLAEDMFMGDE